MAIESSAREEGTVRNQHSSPSLSVVKDGVECQTGDAVELDIPDVLSSISSHDTFLIDVLLATWGILMRRYYGSPDVTTCWGFVEGLCSKKHPIHTDIVTIDIQEKVSSLLEQVQAFSCKALLGQHEGDGNSNSIASIQENCLFFSDSAEPSESSKWTFRVECSVHADRLYLKAYWRPQALPAQIANTYFSYFVQTFEEIVARQTASISDIISLTGQEVEDIWHWNGDVPENFTPCMHDIISEQCLANPNALAVESWDGSLTYGDVDRLSTQVASSLLAIAGDLDVVPLCFEKSIWTIVALLGVLKAGAAFALMDPSQPTARLQTIVAQVEAKVILTSKSQQDLASLLSDTAQIITVGADTPDIHVNVTLPNVPGTSKLYIQFTSGSTGVPKGVIITHANYTSGALPRSTIVGYESTSRVLDFASYAFDVSIDCMLCTLARGGCICVPSDEARVNDLAGAITSMKVNMAHMTPSVARVLDHDVIASLTVLGLGGETMTVGDAAAWTKLTRVIIGYGPSECTVGCTVNGNVIAGDRNPTIGKGVGAVMWIVDPDDHNILLPIGAVGELLVEGPIVGHGYLNDPVKTAEVFISDPKWLIQGSETREGRFGKLYKTGDLAKYDADGCIIFIGRKDTQVKLRGQRVELSEVEHHLRSNLPTWVEVAAEVITPKAANAKPMLVAFICGRPDSKSPRHVVGQLTLLQPATLLQGCLSGIDQALSKTAPIYMIPSAFIPLSSMPMMVSGKLDRKQLRALGCSMSPRELMALRAQGQQMRQPETEMEHKLQQIWSTVLGLSADTISANDNFFGLGGDSIMVMRMVAAARRGGLMLRAHEVLKYPKLSDMATRTKASDVDENEIPAFSLIDIDWAAQASSDVAELCRMNASDIEDVYPCTPLQEALMALSAKRTEAYVAQRVVELPDGNARELLRAAWEKVVAECKILRTRIVYIPSQGLVQVVCKENINWATSNDLDTYMINDKQVTMQLGSQLARYGFVDDQASGKQYFVWTIHHALYDGWSMPLIMERVRRAYMGVDSPPPSEFKTFIKYLKDQDYNASKSYWRSQLRNANVPQFPALPSPGYDPKADSLLERRIALTRSDASTLTASTIIRVAWALVTAQLAETDDVVFGETLMGRNIPVTGADELEGPMITTVPVRVQLMRDEKVSQLMTSVHENSIERIHHEHFGLQHIRRLTLDAQVACDLRTGLVIQPGQIDSPESEEFGNGLAGLAPKSDIDAAKEALHFNSYALMLVCSLYPDGFLVMASFDSKVVGVEKMSMVLEQFDSTVQRLLQDESALVGQFLTSLPSSMETTQPADTLSVIRPAVDLTHQSPTTDTEVKLQKLWSNTIGIDTSEISTSDHFFSLGGDSISAMKLVASARPLGLLLTVADIFRQPKLIDMARFLESAKPTVAVANADNAPLSALNLPNIFLDHVIRPLLSDPTWKIKDVLPVTDDQAASLEGTVNKPRFSIQYNIMYLEKGADHERLTRAWKKLVAHHEILRTIFVLAAGQYLQVVLEELDIPSQKCYTTEDIEEHTKKVCELDSEKDMPLGEPFLKLISITSESLDAQDALVIRMSHTQYDGMSLPNLFLQLKTLYNGGSTEPSPQYSSFIYHMNQKAHLDHWRTHLEGSKLSVLGTYRTPSKDGTIISPKCSFVTRAIDISSRPREITTATFLTAGWATVLARKLSTDDVTFGSIVSSRSIDLADADKIMGMCDNHLPVRVKFQPGVTNVELLHDIQLTRVNNAPYEATQFSAIIEHCTTWADKSSIRGFDSMVHHQDIEYFDTLSLGQTESRLDIWNPSGEPAMEWKVQSFAKDGMLHLEIMCSETFKELAGELIVQLGDAIEGMMRNPDAVVLL